MSKPKLVRITTVAISLDKLLEGQLAFMSSYFDVIAIAADGPYLEKIAKREGVRSYMVPLTRKITPIRDLQAVYTLYRFLKREKVTVVHSHTPKAGIVGMLAARLAGVEHRLHTVAGLPLMEVTGLKRKVLNFVESLTYRCATKVYPNSLGLTEFIKKEKFCAPFKLKVIGHGSSNGIDTQFFNPELYTENDKMMMREELGISKDAFIFVFVGRLVADKGINELVAAFNRVSRLHSKAVLVLVGPFEDELDPLAKETRTIIDEHSEIYAVGYQDDVRPYFAFAQALAFPSYREGFPNVVMQGGAMGLPCIVTDINGCNEIIQNGLNGIIVKPKDDKSLEDAMLVLMEDRETYKHLRSAARSEITASFEREVMHQAILQEYNSFLRK
jgi:glycosyltransferase involved in cell wall biosynthesis